MAKKTVYFVILVLGLSLVIEDAEAGWKFWKKDKNKSDGSTTTVAPLINGEAQLPAGGGQNSEGVNAAAGRTGNLPSSSSSGANNNGPVGSSSTGAANPRNSASSSLPGSPSSGTRTAIAGAANPSLAVGIGETGTNIRNNARPARPNPGTEVGLDISGPLPARPGTGGKTGQGYRDWAADLTGAGEGRQPPKVPSQGPALTGNGQQQPQQNSGGNRPASPTNSGPGQTIGGSGSNSNNRQSPPVPGPRPGSPQTTGGATGQQGSQYPSGQSTGQGVRPVPVAVTVKPNVNPGSAGSGGTQVSTLHVGSLSPGGSRPGSPGSSSIGSSSGYGSSGNGGASSPTGGSKSWAEIAGNGGNARPASPTPAPRPGQAAPGGRAPNAGGYSTSGGTSPGLTPSSGTGGKAGAAIAGGVGVAAGAAGAAASTALAGTKVYSSNPTYSKGNTVTDEDLEKLAEALFIKDTNNANRYITLNLQKQTTGSNTADQAPQPLLTVSPEALQIPTIQKVIALHDNYKVDTRTNEYISPAQRNEESLLVDTFLSTNVMSAAMRFLADKGFVRKDYYDYKDTLRRIWFNLYSRGDGKIGSAGFEHVFLTELKLGTEVSGLHNWIYFNAEEVARRADYLGYIKKVDLGNKAAIVKIHAKYNNIDKPVTTMFIGTSPELEMALYTVCFFTRQDVPCPVSLGGTKFNIITHKFRYRGKDLIGSAYPDI